jgi:hypothetical protein
LGRLAERSADDLVAPGRGRSGQDRQARPACTSMRACVRFRRALTIIDPAVLPDAAPGPQHRHQQARLRLGYGQPATIGLRWVESGRPPLPVQLDLIAAQLRHADGGGLAQRVYIHQLPQTASRAAEMIEGVFGPAARERRAVSAPRRAEGTGGKSARRTRPDRMAGSRVSAAQKWCGRDRIRTCVGNAGDFTGRTAVTPRVPSHPHLVPAIACDVHKRPVDSFVRPSASPPVPAHLARPNVRWREVGGKSRLPSDRVHTYFLPAFVSSKAGGKSAGELVACRIARCGRPTTRKRVVG